MNKTKKIIRSAKELNSLTDQGETLEIKYVLERLSTKQLFPFLKYRFKDSLDISFLTDNDILVIEEQFSHISTTSDVENNGVISNGLNLLIACCLIIIDNHLSKK